MCLRACVPPAAPAAATGLVRLNNSRSCSLLPRGRLSMGCRGQCHGSRGFLARRTRRGGSGGEGGGSVGSAPRVALPGRGKGRAVLEGSEWGGALDTARPQPGWTWLKGGAAQPVSFAHSRSCIWKQPLAPQQHPEGHRPPHPILMLNIYEATCTDNVNGW